ncbi:polyphosphate polymerase domain-containing protein [Bacteroidota bacterium]
MGDETSRIIEIIEKFPSISLEEMDNVRLMNRTDTKFIFPAQKLPLILDKAAEFYRILSIDDKRIFRYNSLYFDTPGLKTYFDHHNGIRPRYKVRFREYENSGTVYLEVKRKVATERTRKSRVEVEQIEHELSENSKLYIDKRSPLDPSELGPSLWTIFRRITLVGTGSPERITIDIDLLFRHQDEEKSLPFLNIAEVKRNQSNGSTEFMKILKAASIYPSSSSKYCLGTILLKSPIKHNRFKQNILKINKIENVY